MSPIFVDPALPRPLHLHRAVARKRRAFANPALRRLKSFTANLQYGFSMLSAANPDGVVDGGHKNLPVPDLAGPRCPAERSHYLIHSSAGHHHFELHFRKKVHLVFGSPVDLRMSLLASV